MLFSPDEFERVFEEDEEEEEEDNEEAVLLLPPPADIRCASRAPPPPAEMVVPREAPDEDAPEGVDVPLEKDDVGADVMEPLPEEPESFCEKGRNE